MLLGRTCLEGGQTGSHNLVDEQKVLGNDSRRVQDLLLDTVVVPDACVGWDLCFASFDVNSHWGAVQTRLRLKSDDYVHWVVARVDRKSLWDNQEGLGKSLNPKRLATTDSLGVLHDVLVKADFERTSAGNDLAIVDCVLNSSKSIPNSVFNLADGVAIWSTDQKCNGSWVLAILDECEFILTKN